MRLGVEFRLLKLVLLECNDNANSILWVKRNCFDNWTIESENLKGAMVVLINLISVSFLFLLLPSAILLRMWFPDDRAGYGRWCLYILALFPCCFSCVVCILCAAYVFHFFLCVGPFATSLSLGQGRHAGECPRLRCRPSQDVCRGLWCH